MAPLPASISAKLSPHAELTQYLPGTLILDKYRLESRLGEGGMGTVWRAWNVILDVPVALKLIRPDMKAEETAERLLIEARVEAKLKHPNIVRVFDFGQTESGDAFMVMEVLDGLSLEVLLEQRQCLNPIEAVQLVLPVIDALCLAHENGIVHRDLKPGNIFLDQTGSHTRAKVLDFGIAKLVHDESEQQRETYTGKLFGTPPYMAPEQAMGLPDIDHRVDVWAICVVLYEAISGRPAFTGDGYAVLQAVIQKELAPLTEKEGGETSLWPILARGLAKKRAQRYPTMRELGAALAGWLSAQGETEDISGNRLSRSWGMDAHAIVDGRFTDEPNASTASGTAHGLGASDIAAGLAQAGMSDPGSTATLEGYVRGEHYPALDSDHDTLAGGPPPGMGRGARPRAAFRPSLALALAIMLGPLLVPSKTGSERPALHAGQSTALAQVDVSALVLPSTVSPATAAAPSLVHAPDAQPPAAPHDARPALRHRTEAELGLKVPY